MFKSPAMVLLNKTGDVLEKSITINAISIHAAEFYKKNAEHYKQQFESLLEDVGHCAGVCDICALTDDECAEENGDSRCTFRWRGLKEPPKEDVDG